VAMTRAVHALHVVLSYSDKPNDNSFAGVLLSTLCEGAERKAGVIYENGDASWYQEPASQQPASESDIDVSKYYQHHQAGEMFRPLSRETRSKRGVERIRPSWLEGGSKVKLADTLVSPDRERMLEFGSLLHACFEPIQWLDTPQQVSDLSRSSLVDRLQKMVPGTAQVGRAVDRFFELLQQPNLRQLFSSAATREKFVVDPQSVLEVRTEQRLAVLLDPGSSVHADSIIQGTIDRLVIVREGTQAIAAEITDFKVDHINEDNLADRIKFYRPQIRAYREAIREMYGLADSQIATQLVFVQSGHVVQMDFFDNSVASDTDLKLPKSPPPGVRSEVKSASRPAPPKPALRKPETAQSKSEPTKRKPEPTKRKPETVKRKPEMVKRKPETVTASRYDRFLSPATYVSSSDFLLRPDCHCIDRWRFAAVTNEVDAQKDSAGHQSCFRCDAGRCDAAPTTTRDCENWSSRTGADGLLGRVAVYVLYGAAVPFSPARFGGRYRTRPQTERAVR